MRNLPRDLASWDGKSSKDILEIYDRHLNSPRFVKNIVSLISSGHATSGVTWLLKHYFDCGGKLNASDTRDIFDSLPELQTWEARLHLLQCLPFMSIAQKELKLVKNFVRKGLSDENKFVRAWSYNGLYELAMAYPELREEAKKIFAMAMEDEAASVKARIRNVMNKGFP